MAIYNEDGIMATGFKTYMNENVNGLKLCEYITTKYDWIKLQLELIAWKNKIVQINNSWIAS